MTYAEVESTFGQPADQSYLFPMIWSNDDGSQAILTYGEDNLVSHKEWAPSTETLMQKIRRWIR